MTTLKTERVEFMPEVKEDGILYVSEKFQLAIHKCPCGCGSDSVTPFDRPGGWELTMTDERATLWPSLLNRGCGTHYWVRDGEVVQA